MPSAAFGYNRVRVAVVNIDLLLLSQVGILIQFRSAGIELFQCHAD